MIRKFLHKSLLFLMKTTHEFKLSLSGYKISNLNNNRLHN